MANDIVWTIGHSNQTIESLLATLATNDIEVVADLRSSPYSRYSPQFNQDLLRIALLRSGIRYIFLGAELGGRPSDARLYDGEGYVRYDLVSQADAYRVAVERLKGGASEYRVALLCGEEDPISCHRRRLVGRTLADGGFRSLHIRADGRVESEAEVAARERDDFPERFQLTLDGPEWKSEHPVKARRRGGEGG
jgi:uncharacterized protein (DUF488 family)